MTTIGERIRAAREARGFGSRELSRRAGYSHSLISNIEAGRTAAPSLAVMFDLATALDLPCEWLSLGRVNGIRKTLKEVLK